MTRSFFCLTLLRFLTRWIVVRNPSLSAVEPVTFKLEHLGGELVNGSIRGAVPTMVARLPRKRLSGMYGSIFLSMEEYLELVCFISEDSSQSLAQLLLPVGAIKSGKSTLLLRVIEGLVVALRRHDAENGGKGISTWPPPVFFKFTLLERCTAEKAARTLIGELREFARSHGIHMPSPLDSGSAALEMLPGFAGRVVDAFSKTDHQLWLLIDEAQGPILGSDYAHSDEFAQAIKHVRYVVSIAIVLSVDNLRFVLLL